MGKPSLIVVDDIILDDSSLNEDRQRVATKEINVSFDLLGRVEIDGRETMKLDDEDSD